MGTRRDADRRLVARTGRRYVAAAARQIAEAKSVVVPVGMMSGGGGASLAALPVCRRLAHGHCADGVLQQAFPDAAFIAGRVVDHTARGAEVHDGSPLGFEGRP